MSDFKLDRKHLPQIPSEKIPDFLRFLHKNKVKIKKGNARTKDLEPIQKKYKPEKVTSLKQDENALKKPVVVSKTGKILDGHHRWVAIAELGEKFTPVILCLCDINKLIALGHKFKGSFTAESCFPKPFVKSHSEENNEDDEAYMAVSDIGFRGNYGSNAYKEELEEAKRNYKREYETYHKRPDQKKRRAQRNKSRRKMERAGKVRKGDGKDVHHSNRNTADTSSKNLKVISRSKNRSMK